MPFHFKDRDCTPRGDSHRRRLAFEPLEDRRLLAPLTVSNLNDIPVTGPGQAPGTLRQAVYDANQTAEADTIQFAAGLHGNLDLVFAGDTVVGPSALVISSPITIEGNASGITISRLNNVFMRLFRVASDGDLTLRAITLTGGFAQGAPGEIGRGGAVFVSAGGHLQVVDSALINNIARGGSGAHGRGGAIYADHSDLIVSNSTLSDNKLFNGNGDSAGFGGGIYSHNGTTSILNSTLAEGDGTTGYGAYLFADNGITAHATIQNTLISQSDPLRFANDFIATDENGGQMNVSGGFNLIAKMNNFTSISLIAGEHPDLLVGPLQNNGGPTPTRALLPESPAIDAGDPAAVVGTPGTPDYDQRGGTYVRVFNGDGAAGARIDIGAFERQPDPVGQPLPGDYNGDHTVNAADYTVWRNLLGFDVDRYTSADGNGSGRIDAGDYVVWKAHYGEKMQQASGQGGADLLTAEMSAAAPADVKVAAPVVLASAVAADKLPRAAAPVETWKSVTPSRRLAVATRQGGMARPAHDQELLRALSAVSASTIDREARSSRCVPVVEPGGAPLHGEAHVQRSALSALGAASWDQLWTELSTSAPRCVHK